MRGPNPRAGIHTRRDAMNTMNKMRKINDQEFWSQMVIDRLRSGAGSPETHPGVEPGTSGFADRRTTVVKWAEFGVTDRTRTG